MDRGTWWVTLIKSWTWLSKWAINIPYNRSVCISVCVLSPPDQPESLVWDPMPSVLFVQVSPAPCHLRCSVLVALWPLVHTVAVGFISEHTPDEGPRPLDCRAAPLPPALQGAKQHQHFRRPRALRLTSLCSLPTSSRTVLVFLILSWEAMTDSVSVGLACDLLCVLGSHGILPPQEGSSPFTHTCLGHTRSATAVLWHQGPSCHTLSLWGDTACQACFPWGLPLARGGKQRMKEWWLSFRNQNQGLAGDDHLWAQSCHMGNDCLTPVGIRGSCPLVPRGATAQLSIHSGQALISRVCLHRWVGVSTTWVKSEWHLTVGSGSITAIFKNASSSYSPWMITLAQSDSHPAISCQGTEPTEVRALGTSHPCSMRREANEYYKSPASPFHPGHLHGGWDCGQPFLFL